MRTHAHHPHHPPPPRHNHLTADGMRITRYALLGAALLTAACATASTRSQARTEGPGNNLRAGLPPVPPRDGPLAIDVVYPDEGQALTAADSNFIFGSVGSGRATLTINGASVEVAPDGAFLGFLPVPADGVYEVVAQAPDGTRATLRRAIRAPERARAPERGGVLSIVPGTLSPRGAWTVTEGEAVAVRFRGTPGAQARLLLPDGTAVPLVERTAVERAEGFQQDVAMQPRAFTEYGGWFAARAPLLAGDRAVASPLAGTIAAGSGTAVVEMARGRDTVRVPLDLSLAVLPAAQPRVGVAAGERADSTVTGQALPGTGTPYQWFWPNGTVFAVTGERDGFYRVRLTADRSAWIDQKSIRLLPAGSPLPSGTVSTVRVVPAAEWIDLRVVTSDRLPFRVVADGRFLDVEVYGAQTRTNWAHYGPEDAMVRRLSWDPVRDDLYHVRLELARPVWGWKSFYDASGTLVIRVRRPPRIDPRRPLAGLRIAVDAGHPPGGAIGPTRLTEADANLMLARRLVRLLRGAGAEVLETRPDTAAVGLGDRPLMAERWNAHLLVSMHNNAFPDGVNPFTNSGTTGFYNAPQGMELARLLQHEIVAELGTRDLGIARADLALVRNTWFPSTLTETMFLMVPRQEAALRDPAVQERIARAHFRAIAAFLRYRAAEAAAR